MAVLFLPRPLLVRLICLVPAVIVPCLVVLVVCGVSVVVVLVVESTVRFLGHGLLVTGAVLRLCSPCLHLR